MAGISHQFTSAKSDGGDATLVRPSDWNAAHLIDGVAFGSGTSFPGSPTADDLCYRTDRNILYFYDGTRWLSVDQYHLGFTTTPGAGSTGITSTNDISYSTVPLKGVALIYIEMAFVTVYVSTTNDGSKYWTVTLQEGDDGTPAYSTLATMSTQSLAADQYLLLSATSINTVIPSDSVVLFFNAAKVSTPGTFYCNGSALVYRLVG